MKKTLIILMVFFLIAPPAFSAEEKGEGKIDMSGIMFHIYYASVQNVVKHGDGCFDQLSQHPNEMLLSRFWWGYIMKECDEYYNGQIERLSKYKSTEVIDREVHEMQQRCAMSVIFDNWDRINSTISRNPQKECKPIPKPDGKKQK